MKKTRRKIQESRDGDLIGYARTSTAEQTSSLSNQVKELQAAGAKKIFKEQVSSVAQRDELARALEYVRDKDTLCVTRLDRLARSAKHLQEILDLLEEKNVALRILNMGGAAVDTRGASGRLVLNMLSAYAQYERELLLERQKEGIAAAKVRGVYKGRKPTARAKSNEIVQLKIAGKGVAEICRALSISRASVYRILNHQTDG
jgi:DNA invertase Pin-like site-specific DNA recombinase